MSQEQLTWRARQLQNKIRRRHNTGVAGRRHNKHTDAVPSTGRVSKVVLQLAN